jgi:3-phosphoshikimate 1-carboxyvinyltransferase
VSLPGDDSSQFVSALLLIAPRTEKGLHIELTTPPRSRPYLEMTLECLRRFGIRATASPDLREFRVARQDYQPASYRVEGDWSQASYLLALGALSGEVLVTNLSAESLQGDRVVLNLLQKMGASFSLRRGSVLMSRSRLKAVSADLSDCIDLLPTMAVLASVAEGQSEFRGIKAARLKESNRVLAIKEEMDKMGVRVIEDEDSLSIIGGRPHGAVIDSHGDHRLAMAFGVLGTAVGDTTILGAECVAKTYPDFWRVLESLGGRVKTDVK